MSEELKMEKQVRGIHENLFTGGTNQIGRELLQTSISLLLSSEAESWISLFEQRTICQELGQSDGVVKLFFLVYTHSVYKL